MDLPKEVISLFECFDNAGFQLYLVGGAVRDFLIKKDVKDWDFTTNATPEEILKIIPTGYYNNKFGTVGLNTELGVLEITTMRKESDYSDSRHPQNITWTNNLEEDLKRRDFTINAMAMDKNQNIIDPFNGQLDLKNGSIKAVGDANLRFQEDALRLMRAIRFSCQLSFTTEIGTLEAIKKASSKISNISYERIRDELFKLLSTDKAYEGMLLLRETGILKIILPELEECFNIDQVGPKHDREYNIGEHSFLSLKHCPSTNPLTRFAALIHDIGKPATKRVESDGNVTFHTHEMVGARIAKKIGERFHLSKKEIDILVILVRWHMFTLDEKQTDSSIRRFIKNVGIENIDEMMAVRVGDRLGGGTKTAVSWRMEEFRKRIDQVLEKPFSVTDLKVNGQDVMRILNIPPGRKVGEILDQLFKEVLEDANKNTKEYLESKISELF